MPEPLIRARQIGKTFKFEKGEIQALRAVNLDIPEGAFTCLIGPSGCGKSSLLRILSGLDQPTQGTVQQTKDFVQTMIFQSFALFPWLNVRENVEFGLKMTGVSQSEREKRAENQLKVLGLSGFESKHPKELSGGMKQRAGIARAFVLEPGLIWMDEPFSALDAFTAETLRSDVLALWKKNKMTVVMVTHLVDEAVELADRVIVFSPRPGTVKKVIDIRLPRPRHKRDKAFYHYVDQIQALIEEKPAERIQF